MAKERSKGLWIIRAWWILGVTGTRAIVHERRAMRPSSGWPPRASAEPILVVHQEIEQEHHC